jgi:hypothetical protein
LPFRIASIGARSALFVGHRPNLAGAKSCLATGRDKKAKAVLRPCLLFAQAGRRVIYSLPHAS